MIEVGGGVGCVGGGAMRNCSDGTAGGYSRGGLWKVSASCAVTWSPRIPQRPILHAAVFVSFLAGTRHCDVHHGAKGGNPGCPISPLLLSSCNRQPASS